MQQRRDTREGAERPPEERVFEGGSAAERGGRGEAILRHGCAGGCAGRSGRTEPPPTPRAERSKNREGALHPPPDSERERAEGRGDEGGRGQGARPTRGGRDPTTRQRAQRTIKKRLPEPTSGRPGARSLDGKRPEPRRGAYSEVRALRDELAERRAFDSQCPLSVARGADARRHAADA